ncbi:hypothetical protein HAX54_039326 [Datura stramonium]|uniref:Secreted protein n=1 Tax=Datura stramonium TaxID=4076 RepID=A0ABS8SIY6_DATST|nr:hypothetical protein [Datura stramonium]
MLLVIRECWEVVTLIALVHVLLVMQERWNLAILVALAHVLLVLEERQNLETPVALVPTLEIQLECSFSSAYAYVSDPVET